MNRGFTLLETLAALVIMGILIYFATSAFANSAPKYRLGRATWEIQTKLNYARYRAIRDGRPIRVRFQDSGYIIERYLDGPAVWRPESAAAIEGVTVQANNTPTFYPAGTVSNFATILVSNAWGKNKITLAITGRIKVTRL